MKIKTKYDPKPIPNRAYDWEAWDEDLGEASPRGFGEDEKTAVDELQQLLEAE